MKKSEIDEQLDRIIWDDKRSQYSRINTKESERITGVAYYENTSFKFSLKSPNSSKYLYRGTLSIVHSGEVLQYRGTQKNQIAKRIEERKILRDENTEKISSETKKDARFNCSIQIYCNEKENGKIKRYLSGKIVALYEKAFASIQKSQELSIVPDLINANMAAIVYGEKAIKNYYYQASLSMNEKRIKRLKKICSIFPETAMAKISTKEANRVIRRNNLSEKDKKLLSVFWDYLIEKGLINGANPFYAINQNNEGKSKKTVETLKYNASIQKTLDKFEGKFLNTIHKEPSPYNCALILIYNGVPTSKIEDVLCGNFFRALNGELCLELKYDFSGATHKYIVPILGEDARIIEQRIEIIKEKSQEEYANYHLCSKVKSKKALSVSEINSYFRKIAREIGLEEDIRKRTGEKNIKPLSTSMITNSHSDHIDHELGLFADQGTAAFLKQQRLNSVTNNHYVSYSDNVAIDRLCTILRPLQPEHFNSNLEEIIETEDGMAEHIIKPYSNKYKCGLIGEIVINPGEIVEIKAEHGVNVTVEEVEVIE